MKKIVILLACLIFINCGSLKKTSLETLQLKFLDEYILPDNIIINETLVGGLSGIDYHKGIYYLVCDDASNPRYYEATIDINNNKIKNIVFNNVTKLKDNTHYLDIEAIRFNVKSNSLFMTSEGSIKQQKDPSFFNVNAKGTINYLEIPNALKAGSLQKPRNNGTLEGLCMSFDKKGYWIAMELPLEVDGPEPQLIETKSPVRLTYMDIQTKKPTKQFAYLLDKIAKKPLDDFAVNGLTDILEYNTNQFIIIERSYSSGLGKQGNTVKLFKIDASNITNTLTLDNLEEKDYLPAKKTLLFDFDSVRTNLTDQSIDNIEGITFGPLLANGNQTIILVSDNNFNKLGQQMNQFILLEVFN